MDARARVGFLMLFLPTAVMATAACTRADPRGTGLSISVRDLSNEGVRSGELLAVRDTGIVFLVSGTFLFYSPFEDGIEVESARDGPRVRYEGFPDIDDRRKLQTYARYAVGLDDERLARILASLDQDSLLRWPPVSGGPTRAELEAGAQRAAIRFADPRAASLEGYRAVGPDFPGMGTHWIHVPTLMSRDLDPDRPAILCYTRIEGQTKLVNVAYGVAVAGSARPPAIEGVPGDLWHAHRGTVADEMLHPHGHGRGTGDASGPGVFMVHVWVTPNPGGLLAQHNWALPFLRAGVRTPDRPAEAVSRFVALGTPEGLDYQLRVVELIVPPHALDEANAAVRTTAAEASRWIDGVRSRPREAVTDRELERAAVAWRALGRNLESLTTDDRARRALARLHGLKASR